MSYSVKIILDSVNENYEQSRITTFQVTAPRIILAEINTHRILAKSAASSRAIPVKKRNEMVRTSPYIPEAFGKNKPGMQATENLSDTDELKARDIWNKAIGYAITCAEEMDQLGTHKQHANRLVESFCFYTGVITGTEWDNFYNLRTHPDAQPEFQKLARMMQAEHKNSTPVTRKYHLPYAETLVENFGIETAFRVSAARCARSSYMTFDGKESQVKDDLRLCEDLINGGHMSPFDHQGVADGIRMVNDRRYWMNPRDHRQYFGWIPERVFVEKSHGMIQPRNSYDPLP